MLQASPPTKVRQLFLTRPFLSLYAQNLLFFSGLNLFGVIPAYLEALGASRTYIGLFNNLNSLALVLLVIPLSAWIDRLGRKRLLGMGYVLALLGLALMVVFPADPLLLIVFKALGTLLFCVAFMVHQAESFELVPTSIRVAGIAVFGTSGLLSNPISSFLGEALLRAPWAGGRGVFVASAAFLVLSMVLALLHRWHQPATPPARGAFLRLARRKELRVLIVLTLIFGGMFTVYATFLANLTQQVLGTVAISPFFTAFTVIALVARFTMASWLDRLNRRILVGTCFALATLSFALSPFLSPDRTWLLVLMGLCYGLAHSILFPVLSTMYVNSGESHEKLGLTGLFASLNTLGNFGFALTLGFFGDQVGLIGIFIAMTGFSLFGAILAYTRCR